MAEVGWDEVTYLKKKPQRAAEAKSSKVRLSSKSNWNFFTLFCFLCVYVQVLNAAQRRGEAVDTTKKCKCYSLY